MTSKLAIAFGVLITWFVAMSMAAAEDAKWSGWRIIASDQSFATSDCIGNTDTPECIADTWVACFAYEGGPFDQRPQYEGIRRYKDFCRPLLKKVGYPPAIWSRPIPDEQGLTLEFYKFRISTIKAEDIDPRLMQPRSVDATLASGLPEVLPGDTLIELNSANCIPTSECLANWRPGDQICPPVWCAGFDGDGPTSAICGKNGYPYYNLPDYYVVLRNIRNRFVMTHYYGPSNRRPECGSNFLPDKWLMRK